MKRWGLAVAPSLFVWQDTAMSTREKLWERLKAVEYLIWEDPVAGNQELHATLSQIAKIRNPPLALWAFAEKIRGTAWRANGDFEQAEQCYLRAEGIYRKAFLSCEMLAQRRALLLDEADLYRRQAFLHLEQRDWTGCRRMLDAAEVRFTLAGERHEVGHVLLARGQLFWERAAAGEQDRALELLSRALELIDPAKSKMIFESAEHNLASALALHPNPSPDSLERAFRALQRSRLSNASKRPSERFRRRQRFGRRELTIPDAKRRYLQGKIQLRLNQHDEARLFLETARTDLMLLSNHPRDVFSVTLDLAECYLGHFRRPWRQITDLLAQTFALCPVTDLNPEAETALELLQTALAAQNFTKVEKQLAAVREKIR